MAIKVRCPGCGSRASVADQHAGKAIRCKRCGGRVSVAATVHPEARVTLNPMPGADSEEMPNEIGGFAVRRVLGAGAFGTVYLGHDRTLDRPVALKVPHPHTFTTPKARKRFETEARAVAQLRHPHIVPIYSAGFDGTHYFIASQFIAGPAPKGDEPLKAMTLEEAVEAKEGGLAFQKAARIVHDLAEALAYAHELGIVHRDVKPANVLLDEQGRAHLADFGLAHQESSAEKLTHDGAILGTPAYMAPEQAKGREGDVLPASDQYSLGIVLYELLTGKAPFSGPVGLVLSLHQNEEVKPPHKVRASMSLDLETICLKALEKDPDKRYGSCGQMAADLGRWLEGEPIRARRMGLVERATRWVRRNPVIAGLTAAVAASLLLGTLVATVFAARATQQERLATAAAVQAGEEKKRAQDAATQAEQEKKRAEDAIGQVREEKQASDRRLYISDMRLVQHGWEENMPFDQVVELVDGQRPEQTGGIDLRGWEWFYWDRLCHPNVPTLKGHTSAVVSVAFSPDGNRLASASEDQTVKVWDAASGQELLTLKGHTGVVFSPDGKRLASAGQDGTVKVWDAASGQEVLTLKGHTIWVNGVAFSPDGHAATQLCIGCPVVLA